MKINEFKFHIFNYYYHILCMGVKIKQFGYFFLIVCGFYIVMKNSIFVEFEYKKSFVYLRTSCIIYWNPSDQ